MKERSLKPRPADVDYKADLKARFGSHPAMLNMAAIGLQSDERKPYQVVNRIAVVTVAGVLCNDAYWDDETDYRDIQGEVMQASEDTDVDATLLFADSPGGDTENAFETAAVIAEAGKKKPIWAVADTMAYSAAYLLISQAAKIYVPKLTGGVGSIGVYCAHYDYSKLLEQSGIDVTLLFAGKGKTDGNPYQPLSAEAAGKIQAEVDRLYGLFVGAVSRGRGIGDKDVRSLGAYCYMGSEASLASRLSDVAGTAEQALADLAAAVAKKTVSISTAARASNAPANVTSPKEVSAMTDTNTAPPPNETLLAEATARGAQAMKDEVKEIGTLCQIAGKPGLAIGYITAGKTAAQVREALAADKSERAGEEINTQLNANVGKPKSSQKERMLASLKQAGRL